MDFFSIRKKGKERAAARAREGQERAPEAARPAAPAPSVPIEDALRDELSRLEAQERAPSARARTEAEPPIEAPPEEPARFDPLDEFFWSEEERVPPLPDLGQVAEAAPAAAAGQARREFVSFTLGSEEYGVGVERVREVLRAPRITEVPRAPAHVLGVVNVRGDVIAVIDPRRRLSVASEPGREPSRIVVCESADGPAGLLVDAVADVVRLDPAAIEPRPPSFTGPASEAIAGIGREDDRLLILLDLDVLLRGAAEGTR